MAVLDLDIDDLPAVIEARPTDVAALVLLRVQGRPAGQAVVPLVNGRCNTPRQALLEGADSAFWEALLSSRLDPSRSAPPPAPKAPATVAVCTRDRTEDLRRCVAALLAMPEDGQEILVVDNAPRTEATRDLLAGMPRIRYIREDRPGLDVARNRALQEARTEIVAFTDDDAAPDALWLRTLLRNFDDPLVGAVTGPTLPIELETEAQMDFQRFGGFLRGYKRMVLDGATHDPLLGWHAGAGVNMAVRRSALSSIGPFDEALDAGTPTQAGGDADMYRRLIAGGWRIVYDPEALNWHRHRRSAEELVRQMWGYEVAGSAVLWKTFAWEGNWGGLVQYLSWFARELALLGYSIRRRPGTPAPAVVLKRIRGGMEGARAYARAKRA